MSLACISANIIPSAPLFIQGGLEDAVVDDETVYNSGGTITVNGFEIIVPKNLLVQFPG